MLLRELGRSEVEQVWTIDRSEIVENIYYHEGGRLVLKPEYYDMQGWVPGEPEHYTPMLLDCCDRGGTFLGAFEGAELVGVVVLESKFTGKRKDQLQMKFLHVSNSYRERGLGRVLFERAVEKARELGARELYISAAPSENTVDFYLHLGCEVTQQVDEDLFQLEPDDIHMTYRIPPRDE